MIARAAFALALACGTGATAQDMVLSGGTLVDAETGAATPDTTIVIQNGRIASVGPAAAIAAPAGFPVIDARGKWLVPGYIDGHVHFHQSGGLFTRPDAVDLRAVRPFESEIAAIQADIDDTLARYLASGVTGVADVGGPMSNFAVRDRASASDRAPHVAVAGPLISTWKPPVISDVADPAIIAATSPEEARALVRAQIPRQPDFVKIWFVVMPDRTAAELLPVVKAAIDEAHSAGLRVAVHATELETARAAVEAGADILVHGVEDKPVDAAFLDLLKRRGTLYTSTIDVVDGYMRSFSAQNGFTEREYALADPEVMATLLELPQLPDTVVPKGLRALAGKPLPTEPMATIARNLIAVRDAGVPIVMGTDAGNIGTLPGPSIYREFARMAQAGMTPREILASATVTAARLMGKTDIGTIKPGNVGDMVVLTADPLADAANLARIDRVVRGGKAFRPSDLVPQTPAEVVQRQVNAYNAGDLDAFLATYHDGATLMDADGKIETQGIPAMRARYGPMFAKYPGLHARIPKRIVVGDTVIDEEIVSAKPEPGEMRAVAIYTVRDGKIATVRFIEDRPPPAAVK